MTQCRHCGSEHIGDNQYCPVTGQLIDDKFLKLEGRIWGGNYKLEKLLGEGALGVTYKGEHLVRKEKIRVKFVTHLIFEKEKQLFELACSTLDKLKEQPLSGIPKVIEYIKTEEVFVVVTEYIEGVTLKDVLDKKRVLTQLEMESFLRKSLKIIKALHLQKILHLAIKPENILITDMENIESASIYLLDTGVSILSAHTDKGIEYRPPELINRETPYLPSTDLYSLAIIAYQGISATLPFKSSNTEIVSSLIIAKKPPPIIEVVPDIKKNLELFIMRNLEKEAAKRAISVEEAEELLNLEAQIKESTLPHQSPLGKPPLRKPKLQPSTITKSEELESSFKESSKRKGVIGFIFFLIVTIIGIGLLFWINYQKKKVNLLDKGDKSFQQDKITTTTQEVTPRKLKMVKVWLKGVPKGALWKFDGLYVNTNPFKAPYSVSPRKITVEAPGYKSFEIEIPLTEDQVIEVKMEPLNSESLRQGGLPKAPKGAWYGSIIKEEANVDKEGKEESKNKNLIDVPLRHRKSTTIIK